MAEGRYQSKVNSLEDIEAQWAALASVDGTRAYRAIWTLAMASTPTVRFLRSRLQPVPSVKPEDIARMVSDLGSDRFAERRKAEQELARIAESARPALLQTLAAKPSLEVRRRAEGLLERLDPLQSLDCLRTLRALEVLENIGSAEAEQLLERLAAGAPQARLTQEAKGTLVRLAKQLDPRDRQPSKK